MKYTKQNPSEDYLSLAEQYRLLYSTEGGSLANGTKRAPKEMFANGEYGKEAPVIKRLMEKNDCRSLINFGCGNPDAFFVKPYIDKTIVEEDDKGNKMSPVHDSVYDYLGRPYVVMYDPGIEELSEYPTFPGEMVVCTDVLEHVPAQDIPWFLDELFNLTTKVLHVTIHLGPAVTFLPDGRNAHVTVRPRDWWYQQIEAAKKRASHQIHVNTVMRYPVDKKGNYVNIDYSQYT